MIEKRKLYFLRNIEELSDSVNSEVIEHEVIADASVIGKFDYGPYTLSIWEFGNHNEGEERKLCLKIHYSVERKESWRTAEPYGFSHGGGLADELIYLSSLFLRRRLKLGPITRIDDRPVYLPGIKDWIDKTLVTGGSNLGDLIEWFRLIENLNIKYYLKFILSAKLYHSALLLVEKDPDLAYLNLVSSIEVLCDDTDIGTITLDDLNDEKLKQLLDSIKNIELRKNIEKQIISREHFIKRKFIKFILNYIDASFWESSKRPEHGRIREEDLEDLLKRIYDQRSATLHNGEPFPPSIYRPPMLGAEIDFSLGVYDGGRIWKQEEFIPNFHFFEKLINHVLKNFLKENQMEKHIEIVK
jgi:hypothetical protein